MNIFFITFFKKKENSFLQVFEQYLNTTGNVIIFIILAKSAKNYEIAQFAFIQIFIQYLVSLQSSIISIPMLRNDHINKIRANYKQIFSKLYVLIFFLFYAIRFFINDFRNDLSEIFDVFFILSFVYLIMDGFRKLFISFEKLKTLITYSLIIRMIQIFTMLLWPKDIDLMTFSTILLSSLFTLIIFLLIKHKINPLFYVFVNFSFSSVTKHLKNNFNLLISSLLENIPGTISLLFLTSVYGFVFIADFKKLLTIFGIISPIFLAIININTSRKEPDNNYWIEFLLYSLSILIFVTSITFFVDFVFEFLYGNKIPNIKNIKIAFAISFFIQSINNYFKGIINSKGMFKSLSIAVVASIIYISFFNHISNKIDLSSYGILIWALIPLTTFFIYTYSLIRHKY